MRRRSVVSALLLSLGAGAAVPAAAADPATAPASAPAPAAAGPRPLGQVVPVPASVKAAGGPFTLAEDAAIHVPAGSPTATAVGRYLADILRPSTGYDLPLTTSTRRQGIVLALDGGADTGSEGYRLQSTPQAVVISAASTAGLFHGVQTLRQLLPAAVERDFLQLGPWTIAGGTITDRPRYAYRGAMLDVARHFHSVAQVERYIDQLALYKINRLHLHLTDDQGWRIAVSSRPRLTTLGGTTEVGGGQGGYYTKAEYQQLVQYAASRYMLVVPEIDMPGHTNAALASYAELNCDGVVRAPYTGTAVGFSSLCVAKAPTGAFVDDVIREVAAMTPGPYLHIGGDEARATSRVDYIAFMDRAQQVVARYGKTVIGWHQIAAAHLAPGVIAQYWGTKGDEEPVAAAARSGTRLIMSPANHAYLDMKYDEATPIGKTWAGYTEVRQSYDWDPASVVRGAPAASVMGVEAPLWSETVSESSDIEYLAFPRLPAIAEVGWSPAASHGWTSFQQRLAAQGPRWTALGIGYYPSPQVPWQFAY
ncbi:beta-N-acetylhexosaminidase [Actinacidiphila soli]|uniref:beta-N-acetylhexosaminidase n=1 Tax=Actinacidiphila soli TaxID=2487275 RepID=UPI000FCC6A66|nr:beta-N-acetylhexosaminidase [Actinacidiphila soli]